MGSWLLLSAVMVYMGRQSSRAGSVGVVVGRLQMVAGYGLAAFLLLALFTGNWPGSL